MLTRITTGSLVLAALAGAGCGTDGQDAKARIPQAGGPSWQRQPDKPRGPAPPAQAGRAHSFGLQTVARGLRTPLQVVARPGDPRRLYVVEQAGTVRVVEDGVVRADPWLDLRDEVRAGAERGLLTLAFDATGERAYAMYTDRQGDTRVVELPAAPRRADARQARILLAIEQPYENHKGGTLLFDDRGRLLLGLGDGGSAFDPQQRAQDDRSSLGKLLRYDPSRPDAGWETVAIGLRNPWRMSFDRETGMLWLADVGQDRVEEVDALWVPEVGQPLLNLGWAAYEGHLPVGTKRLSPRSKLVWPVVAYTHENGLCSVTGGYVYRGERIPTLRGRYVYGDFCRGTLWTLDARGAEDPGALDLRLEAETLPSLTSFGEGLDGELYAVSAQGALVKLVSTNRSK